ncbi:MAG: hypothetical protein AB1585_00420 [Thermodesulfobacteriota bacterium]
MKKALIIFQIVLGLALLVFIVHRLFFQTVPPPDHNPASWKNWEGFFAVSYTGLSKEDGAKYISRKDFQDHLGALKAAGFSTITPEDINAFLRQERPLPAKGLLILFEGGRKDSFLLATPLLKKAGFLATMAIPTAFVESWDNFYLKKRDLKKLAASPYWRLASMGHRAYQKITIDATGNQGHFLTSRQFSGSGVEEDRLFQERIKQDYKKASVILNQAAGKPVLTYLYPFADAGTGPQTEPMFAAVNEKALAEFHSIAFVSSNNPFNSASTPPLHLSRLRVPYGWDGKQLVRRLENFSPRAAAVDGIKDPGTWQPQRPPVTPEGYLTLSPDSDLWVRGTEGWSNLEVDFQLSVSKGASPALFLRYGGIQSFLMLALSPKEISLREKNGTVLQTLNRKEAGIREGRPHRFKILVKANRAWVWMDGSLIFGPTPLAARQAQGEIGLSTRGSEIRLEEFKARPLPDYYVFVDWFEGLSPEMKSKTKAILVSWDGAGPLLFRNEKRKKDILKAAAEGVDTIPVIDLPQGIPFEEREKFASRFSHSLEDPLLKPFIKTLALSKADPDWINTFHRLGFVIIERTTSGNISAPDRDKRKSSADYFLIEGSDEETRKAANQLLLTLPGRKIIVTKDPTSITIPGVGFALRLKQEGRGE